MRARCGSAIALALILALAGCSGGSGDPTGPEPAPPAPRPAPGPAPGPAPDPAPSPGVQGSYVLEQINGSQPGQLVTIANPDGQVIGLYRFEATTLSLDALQTFELELRYTDDKTAFVLGDAGEFKQAGPVSQGALPLSFDSEVYGDSFTGVVLEDIVAIMYDFDGDGQAETSFAFRRGG
jgi:hypothetical protein